MDATTPKRFQKQLQKIRRLRELSQSELARRAGIARETVHRLEKGKCLPTLTTLHALADILRVPVSDLVS